MKIHTTLALGVLCAIPSLIQPASASDNLYELRQVLIATLDTYNEYFQVIQAVKEGAATPDEGAVVLNQLSTKLRRQSSHREDIVARLNTREQQGMAGMVEQRQYTKLYNEIDALIDALRQDFMKKNYYNSSTFKRACQNFEASITRG